MVHVKISKTAKNASAAFIWSKPAAYSDMSWHPGVKSSKNIGSIEDGSKDMVGAVRLLVNTSDKELKETVTEWSDDERYYACSVDEGAPPFAKKLVIKFQVRENARTAIVDMIIDLELKTAFVVLAPLIKGVLGKKLGGFVNGIAELEDPELSKD